MADYRRLYIPGATIFLTLVTDQRQSLFNNPDNITGLRQATNRIVKDRVLVGIIMKKLI